MCFVTVVKKSFREKESNGDDDKNNNDDNNNNGMWCICVQYRVYLAVIIKASFKDCEGCFNGRRWCDCCMGILFS